MDIIYTINTNTPVARRIIYTIKTNTVVARRIIYTINTNIVVDSLISRLSTLIQ